MTVRPVAGTVVHRVVELYKLRDVNPTGGSARAHRTVRTEVVGGVRRISAHCPDERRKRGDGTQRAFRPREPCPDANAIPETEWLSGRHG